MHDSYHYALISHGTERVLILYFPRCTENHCPFLMGDSELSHILYHGVTLFGRIIRKVISAKISQGKLRITCLYYNHKRHHIDSIFSSAPQSGHPFILEPVLIPLKKIIPGV